jgi:hypothetical protein
MEASSKELDEVPGTRAPASAISAGTGQPPGVGGMSSFFRSGVNRDELVFAASHRTTQLYGLLGQRQRPLTKSSKIVRGPLVARFSSHATCASTSG